MLAAFASIAIALMPLDGAPLEPPVNASPALFAVRDQDTTVYIFGTFHVLDPSIHWFDGAVEAAFDQADELVVETLPPQITRRSPAGSPPPISRATPAASFLATSQHAVHAGNEQGMTLDNGADMVLLRSAAATGKEIEPLETLQSQYAMLARLPGNSAGSPVDGGAPKTSQSPSENEHERLAGAMHDLQLAWAQGDQSVFSAMLGEMHTTAPAAYRAMFVERNVRWTDWIAARMRTPGTVFVAVGAGHLAGPDSLLVRLAQRGHISRRVR